VFKSITKDPFDLQEELVGRLSPEAVDLLEHLLVRDPERRFSAQEALEHPWIKGEKGSKVARVPLAGTIVQRLQVYI
jgi:serine/threonine protein kinase